MMDIYEVLLKCGDDSHLEVIEYRRECLKLRIQLDIAGGKNYSLTISHPIHLDMPPNVVLGRIEFGSKKLLPEGYGEFRNRGYEGDEDSWRVMKVTDDEGNQYYVIYSAPEKIEED